MYSLDLVRFSYVIKFDFNTLFRDREYCADGTIDQSLFGVNVATRAPLANKSLASSPAVMLQSLFNFFSPLSRRRCLIALIGAHKLMNL